MEVLPRVFSSTACSISQCSSAPNHGHVRQSSPAVPITSSMRPPALVSSVLASASSLFASVPPSLALSYDDIVNGADNAKSAVASSSFEASSVIDFDAAADFMSSNPMALLAGLAAVAVPFIVFQASAAPQSYGSVSAVAAFAKLSDPEQNAQLLDIRAPEDVTADGTPNLKSLRKKAVLVAYSTDDKSFVDKVLAKYRDAENTSLYILDRFDGNSAAVAKLLADSGFEKAYAIKGGVEGPNGWQKSELPWLVPKKGLNINIDGLKNIFAGGTDSPANLVPATLGAVAAAGIGVAIFTEAETVLQLLGSAAFIQLFVRKFMFADDRQKTIEEVKRFLDTKIAPKELGDELKEVGRILLPKDGEVSAAVATGNAAVEKELKVEAVTPEALAGSVADKVNGAQIRDPEAA